ncbi:hypothetical protein ACIRBZ_40015 [Streptomyces sp. NPDC094038]|uniref:hypothetical protein n=1 Tax=Streptomyces sp. NPDC094038 TaxID=3366055 RepID=UPI0038067ABE
MSGTPGLRPEDRADFEDAVRLALATADVRSALRTDPSGRAAGLLRAWALAAQDEISAVAAEEYRVYLAARSVPYGRPGTGDGTVGPMLAVLTPLISAGAGTVLLLVGYGLRLTGAATEFAASVVRAGWVLAAAAAVTGAAGAGALLWAAARGGGRSAGQGLDPLQARERWRQVLLERGVLPYLRRRLPDALTA